MMNLTTNIKTNLKLILVVPFIVAIVGCGKQTSNPTTKCDADECIETSACVDGSVEAIACGLNNTGTQTQTCTGGEWDYGTCSDPDICINAATQTQACGLNNGGIQTVTCTHGEWVENFCSDSDVCKNGDTQVAPCGLENNGMMTRVCAEGEWSSFGVCVDPDMCDEDAPSTFIVGGAIECGFPAVGALMENGRPFCTGTLISPTAVLTAAHCVDFWTSSSKYEFFMGTDANNAQSGTMIEVSAHYPHPQWTDLNSASYPVTYDVAVIRLATPVAIAPMPFNTDMMSNELLGRDALFVGFGKVSGDYDADYGVKRSVAVPVSEYLGDGFAYVVPNKGACNGDSGGPAFMKVDGIPTLMGVTSYGDFYCAEYGVSTRTDRYNEFIQEKLLPENQVQPWPEVENSCITGWYGDGYCDSTNNSETCGWDGGDCDSNPAPTCDGILSWVGDGFCDSENNSAGCGYDGGDCCESTCSDAEYTCGVEAPFSCKDPNACENTGLQCI